VRVCVRARIKWGQGLSLAAHFIFSLSVCRG